MNEIQYILGVGNSNSPLKIVLQNLSSCLVWQPFDERSVEFVKCFAQKLLTTKGIRQYPELVALGHWFRGANLKQLIKNYPAETENSLVLGRGLAFHIAPSNVDSVFMYSWLLSLLAGNTNIVRVSQKMSDAQTFLINILAETLNECVGKPIQERIVLLTYPHNTSITQEISEACLIRIVWGGNSTVQAIRSIPLRPTATEICFPDRFSICAIRADSMLKLNIEEQNRLAANFYKDAFWFAQQACSSPRLITWVGDEKTIQQAQEQFWNALNIEIATHPIENSEAMNMARINASFEYAGVALAKPTGNKGLEIEYPLKLQLECPLQETIKNIHCGNGLFLENRVHQLTDLAIQLSDKEQTLTTFGFTKDELKEFILNLPPRAVDRIVKIGDALSFAPIWDGQDLIVAFSRKILLS
ncbi:acyl-CoA reductase [Acinetobacter sp. WCHA45]|uniref:acyl-CoA reductase n=1 Tax=Acinetobacter sp. WCHA45 TaxID=2004644 RepID=UPI000B3C0C6C|nr:acyl-CoA reductase [Acinetobacter sp. WCHA45]AVZ84747.1 hypothetical protein CDG55_02595 [Acinetobacter sp. WCHA45]